MSDLIDVDEVIAANKQLENITTLRQLWKLPEYFVDPAAPERRRVIHDTTRRTIPDEYQYSDPYDPTIHYHVMLANGLEIHYLGGCPKKFWADAWPCWNEEHIGAEA